VSDARLPLQFGEIVNAGAHDALLIEGNGMAQGGRAYFQPGTGHAAGCACCGPRNSAGLALARLLLARARGEGLFFKSFIAVTRTAEGHAAVLEALATDPLASACFTLAGSASDGLSPAPAGR
jgi:hypothetical protein